MTVIIECIILCIVFTIMVYIISRKPIDTLYNYPPKIQERVKSLKEYEGLIPTENNKIVKKVSASILFLIIMVLVLKYINHCTTFQESFITGFLLWSIVNLYDVIVLDVIWFCHDPYFVIGGSEDMIDEYHDYLFHIKQSLIGQLIALPVCILIGLLVSYIL